MGGARGNVGEASVSSSNACRAGVAERNEGRKKYIMRQTWDGRRGKASGAMGRNDASRRRQLRSRGAAHDGSQPKLLHNLGHRRLVLAVAL